MNTLLPTGLLNEDDDWIERYRRFWYPRIHGLLKKVGLYSLRVSPPEQLVGCVGVDEETLEEGLHDVGFVRNPISAYKKTEDGRMSEGSWVLLAENDPNDWVADDYQLHLTMFNGDSSKWPIELYAHHEPDWRKTPLRHLYPDRYTDAFYEEENAADYARKLINSNTYYNVRVRP